jgi:hypothetical protein
MSPKTIQLAFERAELVKQIPDVARGVVTSPQEIHYYIAEASECEIKAKEALDLSVRRYFIKLAHDYRHLAELTEH